MEPVRGFTLHEALAVSPAKIQTIMIWKPKNTKKKPAGLQIRRNWGGYILKNDGSDIIELDFP